MSFETPKLTPQGHMSFKGPYLLILAKDYNWLASIQTHEPMGIILIQITTVRLVMLTRTSSTFHFLCILKRMPFFEDIQMCYNNLLSPLCLSVEYLPIGSITEHRYPSSGTVLESCETFGRWSSTGGSWSPCVRH